MTWKKKKRGQITSLTLLMATIVYMVLAGTVLAFIPPESLLSQATVSGTTQITNLNSTLNSTISPSGETDVREVLNFLDVIVSLFTFNIEGIPTWATIIFVYIPLVALVLGILGAIRGI